VTGARRPIPGKSTWTYQFMVKRNGKRVTISEGGHRTKKLAEEALANAIAIYRPRSSEPSKMLFVEYLRREWLPVIKPGRRPSTWAGYRALVDNYIVPSIGDVRLVDVTPGDIAQLLTELRESGRRDGREGGLAESTLRQLYAVLSGALQHAVEAGMIVRNPASALPRNVKPRVRKKEMHTWDAVQLRAFLNSVRDDRLYAAFLTAAMTGMRRSELVALQWSDIDLGTGQVSVRRGVTSVGYKRHVGETKSGRARTVAIDPETVAVLRRHRATQLEERMKWGEAWTDTGDVFTREDGTALHPQTLSRTFDRRVVRAKLPRISFHGLRHTHATLLLRSGVHPKIATERLGHASTGITLDLYTHVQVGMQEDAAARVGTLVLGGP
jgi:integrase